MARVICPCWRSGHMEKHYDTVAKLKAKSSVKRLSEDTKVNKADVEEFSEDSYTLMCSIFFGDDDEADIPVASNADSTSSYF